MKRAVHCGRLSLALVLILAALLTPLIGNATNSTSTSAGSGFIVTADGYILTNEHVVGDSKTVSVFVDGTAYPASVVTKSVESDLALLKIAASGLTPVVLGNSLQVQLLDDVVALGYPLPQFGRDLTVSEGRITSFRTNVGGREGRDTLQHDAVITHGSSGGPLFNLKGEVIGVNFAGVEGSGMQLAIPINEAVPLLRSFPSFNPSEMGKATQTLTAQEVVAQYGKSVVYIEVRTVIDWQGLLPSPGSVPGFPNMVAVDSAPDPWMQWLETLGLSVIGGAMIATPIDDASVEQGCFTAQVALIALVDSRAAQSALGLLRQQAPSGDAEDGSIPSSCSEDSWHSLGSGTSSISGTSVEYDLDCYWCTPVWNRQWNSPWTGPGLVETLYCQIAGIQGRMCLTVGNVLLNVSVEWYTRRCAYPDRDRTIMTNPYSYSDGYLVSGGRRVVSGQEILTRLQQLTQLAVFTVTSNLAGQ